VKRILDLKDLHHGQHVDDEMKVEVFLAPPNITSATQRNIWSFVQGRPVYDRMLQAAVMDAYRGLLMHGEFPIAVVMVQTAPEDVDVNVHPTKSQVKFLESSKVFRAVQRTVREVLEPAPWVPSQPPQQARWVEEPVPLQTELSFSPSAAMAAPERSVFAEIPRPVLPAQPAATQPSKGWASLQLVGQTRLTYLVAQTADKLVLVDQHAAHERVLFEKLMAAWAGGNLDIQKYLIPLTMDLDANECAALMNAQKDLTKFGIAVEALSPTCLTISSGPSVLTDGALFKGLARLAQESAERGESYAIETAIGEVCATMACHSAVRAGQKLSLEQMVELLESMDQYSFSSFCPHGRPVWVEWEYSAIEREFGRIP
jgi:DNA mismatch repair protein MutL